MHKSKRDINHIKHGSISGSDYLSSFNLYSDKHPQPDGLIRTDDYEDYFRYKISGNHPNSNAKHAEKILPLIHKYAISKSYAIAEGFSSEICNSSAYFESLKDLLYRGGEFKAIVSRPEDMNKAIKAQFISLKSTFKDRIQFKKTSRKVGISLESRQLHKNINTAFNDNSGVRIELDIKKNVGIWNANDSKMMDKMLHTFLALWNHSDTQDLRMI